MRLNEIIKKSKNHLNKATGENNKSILFIRWGGGGVERHIVKAHKHNSIFLTSDAV